MRWMLLSLLMSLPLLVHAVEYKSLPMNLFYRDIPYVNTNSYDVLKDKQGYYWFATPSGLVRYDGNASVRYFGEKGQPLHAWPFSRILESEQSLWVGSAGRGLIRINLHDFTYHAFPYNSDSPPSTSLSDSYVIALSQDDHFGIRVSTLNGLNLIDPKTNRVRRYYLPKGLSSSPVANGVRTVAALSNNLLLCATYEHGFQVLDVEKAKFTPADKFFGSAVNKELGFLLSLNRGVVHQSDSENLIVSVGSIAYEINRQAEVINKIDLNELSESVKGLTIGKIKPGKDGALWLMTDSSKLYRWSKDRRLVVEGQFDKNNSDLGSPNNLYSSDDGSLVLSYLNSSPKFWNPIDESKTVIKLSDLDEEIGSYLPLYAAVDDSSLWLSGDNKIAKISEQGVLEKLITSPAPLYNLVPQENDLHYVQTYSGTYQLNENSKEFAVLSTEYPSNLELMEEGELWLSTISGILRVDASGHKQRYLNEEKISVYDSALAKGPDGNVWLYGRGFLYIFDQTTNQFIKLNNNKLDFGVTDVIYPTREGIFLLGDGFGKIDITSKNLNNVPRNVDLRYILNSAKIERPVCDVDGCWLIDREDSSLYHYQFLSEQLKRFERASGFPTSADVNTLAIHNDRLLLSEPGKLSFIDKPLAYAKKPAKTQLHHVVLFNNSDQNDVVLDLTQSLSLQPDNSALRFAFGDMAFHQVNSEKSRYRLLGLSEKWITTSNNEATFAGLAPGHYEFQVKGINDFNSAYTIGLEVVPVWWQSWPAIMVYVVIVLLLALLFAYLLWDKYRLKLQAQRQIMEYAEGIENVDQGICILSLEGNVISANRSFQKFVDYRETQGLPFADFICTAKNENSFVALWRRAVNGEKVDGSVFLKSSSGSGLPVECSISKIGQPVDGGPSRYIVLVRDISERLEHQNNLERLANVDSLTGLPNRHFLKTYLRKKLQSADVKDSAKIAVVFMDVDRFKNINDSLSHYFGDLLLIELAKRLSAALDESEMIARLGGDEFVVCKVGKSATWVDADGLAKRILAQVDSPIVVDDKDLYISLSLGIAIFPDNGTSIDHLLRDADVAMYSVKAKGGNDFAYYTDRMNEKSLVALKLESDLRKALSEDEFAISYQPKVCLHTGELRGLEALIRWDNPNSGVTMPGLFIDAAERTGIIIKIGFLVLHKVCNDLAQWKKRHQLAPAVAVNVSPLQLLQPNFVEEVIAIMQQYDFNSKLIEFEITEGMVMENMEGCIKQVSVLRNLGHKISVDDFGTGYSSLSYLKKLPIDVLKIDQSFVRGMLEDEDQRSIVKTILALATNLRLSVVAEGIETEQVRDALKEMGCAVGQGYFYAKPIRFDQPILIEILKQGRIIKADQRPLIVAKSTVNHPDQIKSDRKK